MINKIAKKIYSNTIRRYLPYKISVHNGIPVRGKVKLFDFTDVFPNYKESNIRLIKNNVKENDRVVVIGGGIGVNSVHAARQTGSGGVVTVYEASDKRVEILRRTFCLNNVSDTCDVNHAVVGSLNSTFKNIGNPKQISSAEIPDCDVLEMDCEGAELEILSNMNVEPRNIIVETHPSLGASTKKVKTSLKNKGYSIENQKQDPVDGHIIFAKLIS